MPPPENRFQTACELLDSALRIYFQGNADVAALHLAGAAEELLGKHLREGDRAPFLQSCQAVMMRAWNVLVVEDPSVAERSALSPGIIADFLNHAKNHIKHSIQPASYDARSEARWAIARAIVNYDILLGSGASLPEAGKLHRQFEPELIELLCDEISGRSKAL